MFNNKVIQDDYQLNSQMKVLVIDDEIAIRQAMAAVLHSWGCVAILAGSEDEALELIKKMENTSSGKQPPQALIVDYRLRDNKTGDQAIQRLRLHFGADIPALIVTGDTATDRLIEAEASGHTFMHKPVQPGKLRAYLRYIQQGRVQRGL